MPADNTDQPTWQLQEVVSPRRDRPVPVITAREIFYIDAATGNRLDQLHDLAVADPPRRRHQGQPH